MNLSELAALIENIVVRCYDREYIEFLSGPVLPQNHKRQGSNMNHNPLKILLLLRWVVDSGVPVKKLESTHYS